MNTQASMMTGVNGERVALSDVSVNAVLQDLLARVTVTQSYRNDEATNIEAVYTFPLPLDAVLLDFSVTIGERRLTGLVVEKSQAEASYEKAIDAGDAAVMLESIEPGLYTMNVGNLLPHEVATITFSYAMLYRWSGDRLRLLLPTTIAPRYGAWRHQPHQVPETSLTVENAFSLRLEVRGALHDAQFDCPSHAVALTTAEGGVVLSLQQANAVMDRDFILNIRAPQAPRSFVVCGRDGDGVAALASFQPFFPGLRKPAPLDLAVVIDCSGSMNGDSIDQAKKALGGILERLQPDDRVNIIAFGSTTQALAARSLPCTKGNLGKARRFARALDANLGGTEIGAALKHARAALGDNDTGDVFLVTDGGASEWESVIEAAAAARHRVFTVGVGSAVSEAFLQTLASRTGGHCELVSPREGMAERVVRHFERMRAPRAKRVSVHWPEGAVNASPSTVGAVFEGDTVVASATFAHADVRGNVILEVEAASGDITRQALPLGAREIMVDDHASASDGLSTVARVVAASRLGQLDADAARAAALRYQLLSPWTNWLVIAKRVEGEKAEGPPALRKVPQTMAAGWHGIGGVSSVECASMDFDSDSVVRSVGVVRDVEHAMKQRNLRPVFLDALVPSSDDVSASRDRLLALIEDDPSRLDRGKLIELLTESGLTAEIADILRLARDLGFDLETVAAMVVAGFVDVDDSALSPEAAAALVAMSDRAGEAMTALRGLCDQAKALRWAATRSKAAQLAENIAAPIRIDECEALITALEAVDDMASEQSDTAALEGAGSSF